MNFHLCDFTLWPTPILRTKKRTPRTKQTIRKDPFEFNSASQLCLEPHDMIIDIALVYTSHIAYR